MFNTLYNKGMTAYEKFRNAEYELYKKRRRQRLKNTDFTIIASNCMGTFMYYDLKVPFLSPTINLNIEINDFVKMVENLEWYMSQEIAELEGESDRCPVGLLGDITIYFVHYDTFSEGVSKWEERKRRINRNNMFIVGMGTDTCTRETLARFERLPYPDKVIFTHKTYPEFKSSFHIKGYEQKGGLCCLPVYKKQLLKRRPVDDFDYVTFLNRS